MTTNHFFVVASGSPRRREFIELLGLPLVIIIPQIDETPLLDEKPAALVQRLSRLKAEAATAILPTLTTLPYRQAIVVAADTVVVLAGKIMGKPDSPAEARQMLRELRQQPHNLYSGFTITISGQSFITTKMHQSTVWMRPYTDEEIETYIATGDPFDKAGAYGIQNKTFNPAARLDGCFASVMGLPLGMLATILKEQNITLPEISAICTRHIGRPCCQIAD